MAGFGDMLKGAQGMFTNPLFTAGASIYSGAPIGQSMQQAQRSQMMADQQREQAEQKAAWQKFSQSDQVPGGMKPFLPFVSPQAGASAMMSHSMNAPERARQQQMQALQMQKIQKELNTPAAGRYMKSGNQIVEIGPDGNPRVVHQAPESEMDRMKMEFFRSLVQPQQPQPQQQPPAQLQPQSGEVAPGGMLQPMANETGEEGLTDPNLIQAQAVQGQQQQQPQAPGLQLTPEQKQALGANMIMPGAGNLLMKGQEAANKAASWQTPTANKLDENIMNTVEQSARLGQIEQQFNPEFLTVGGGLKAEGAKWWEKVVGEGSLDDKTQQYLQEFSSFKRNAISNINQYIKEITGAQMSEAEAKRLRQAMPDPGDDAFSGDSPTQFKAKLDDSHKMMRLAMARYTYLRSGKWSGGTFTGSMANGAPVSLDQMQEIMTKRRSDFQRIAKMRVPNDPNQQRDFVINSMQQEFGI